MNLEWVFGLSGNSKVLFFTYLVHPDRDVILAIVNTNIEFWKTRLKISTRSHSYRAEILLVDETAKTSC